MKTCSTCRAEKPLEDFAKSRDKRDGRASICKPCTNAYNKSHYSSRRPAYLLKARAWEARQAAKIAAAKDRPCADCGGSFPACVMDFDHLPGSAKAFGLGGGKTRGDAALLAEMAKCDVVCANCHRVRTWNRRQAA